MNLDSMVLPDTRFRSAAFLFCLFALLPAALQAQTRAITQYSIEVWDRTDGLPGNAINGITQTSDGYLWIASEDGLARFDGIRFTTYARRNTPALTSDDITAVAPAREGRALWIGTLGAGLLRHEGGELTSYTTSDGLSNDAVETLLMDADGVLWVGTARGLTRVVEGSITTVPQLANEFVRALAPARGGGIWAGTERSGIYRIRDGAFDGVPGAEPIGEESVRAMLEDPEGALWIGTSNGLFHLKDGRLRTYTERDGLSSRDIEALHLGEDHGLWIGTVGGGLSRLHEGTFETLTQEHGLPTDIVSGLFEDREGNLWVATGGGIAVLRSGVFLPITPLEGLPGEVALPVLEDRTGAIWMGTFGGGLSRLRDGTVTTFSTEDGLSSDFVVSLAEGADGTLWIGTRSGLNQRRGGRISSLLSDGDDPEPAVTALLVDREGELLVGTSIGVKRLQDDRLVEYVDGFAHWLLEDRAGALWVGTRGEGLIRRQAGEWRRFTTDDGLPSNVVMTLHEEEDGTLWIATTGGLSRFRDGSFSPTLDTSHGLWDETIYRLLDDGHGFFWMSSNRGIFRLPREQLHAVADGTEHTLRPIRYDESDGLPSSEANGGFQPTGWKSRDGRLWFPTMRGFAVVDPASARPDADIGSIVIERFHVDDEDLPLMAPRFDLAAGTRRIEIDYTAPSFTAPDLISFQYRMDGYDEDWVDAGTNRTAVYTNLPPGRYAFRIRARTRYGEWIHAEDVPAFGIEPRFYQTWPFYALLILLVGGGILGVDRARVRSHRTRERELLSVVEERRRAERRYRALFENATDIVLTADLQGRITSLNRQGKSVLGIERVSGDLYLEEVVGPQSHSAVAGWLSEAASGTVRREAQDIVLRSANGADMHAEATVQIIREDEHGSGIQAIIRDVTERRGLEEQLRQSQKLEAIGRLAGGVAHDFNNLLNVIKGCAFMLRGDLPSGSTLQEDAAEIEQAADRAASLTQQLLAFGRQQVLQPKVMDLNAVVHEVARLLDRTIGEDIEIRTGLDPRLQNVEVDPGQIHQVLMNLAVNARDAMPGGGELTISTCNVAIGAGDERIRGQSVPPGDYACLRVSDTGVGMDEDTRGRIFEPFYTTKGGGGGSGLGLATVYGIVNQSGGFIAVDSKRGRGTTFEIFLPGTTTEVPEVAAAPASEAGRSRGETLLLVEDDRAVRTLFRRVLEREGYAVLEASNGEEALRLIEEHGEAVALVISDVVMPVMGGVEMARALAQRVPELRVLFTSGYAADASVVGGEDAPRAAFLQKPADPSTLRRKVREMLDRDGDAAGS